jgi:hypothetical protein
MEPLFLAVICGCNAGLLREALHEVYIPRIQRGNVYFAAKVLGAKDLSAAACFLNCTGSAACFSRLWVLTRLKLRLHSVKPSESQSSKSRFR